MLPWASYSIPLCLGSLICKIKTVIALTSQDGIKHKTPKSGPNAQYTLNVSCCCYSYHQRPIIKGKHNRKMDK